ncbi:MAG: 2-amino-4-hydroxy-6-hydroxymethyldihydropteridine diphosphokinase [bacterium]
MKKAYLLIGGNIGDRLYYLTQGNKLIEQQCGHILGTSSIYETAAWGKMDQAPFLNQVLLVETVLDPLSLLDTILDIENSLGRKRKEKYDARTIDIDILYYDNEKLETDILTIPHPKISERRFVLTPLAEIAPDLVDPTHNMSIKSLLAHCLDALEVKRFKTEDPA